MIKSVHHISKIETYCNFFDLVELCLLIHEELDYSFRFFEFDENGTISIVEKRGESGISINLVYYNNEIFALFDDICSK